MHPPVLHLPTCMSCAQLLHPAPTYPHANPPTHPPTYPIHCTVYTAFYLQSAVALLRPGGSRSLHIGLGVGTAVKGMQRLGVAAGGWPICSRVGA